MPFRRRRGCGCLIGLTLGLALLVAAAFGVYWWLTLPPPLPTIPSQYLLTVEKAAATCPQLSVPLLAAQIDTESKWNPQADSGQAQGIAQFDTQTWTDWGRDYAGDGEPDVWDPRDAIPTQAAYMCHLFRTVKGLPGDQTRLALAAYNAGPTAVLDAHGVPLIPQTLNYVNRIEALIPKYRQSYAQQLRAAAASPSPGASHGGG